jgi:hypothetical protein
VYGGPVPPALGAAGFESYTTTLQLASCPAHFLLPMSRWPTSYVHLPVYQPTLACGSRCGGLVP